MSARAQTRTGPNQSFLKHREVQVESLAPSGHSTNSLLAVTRHLLEKAES